MFSVMTTNSTADASSSGSNNLQEDAVPGVTMKRQPQRGQLYLEMSSMNDLLSETDQDTDLLSAWVALRNNNTNNNNNQGDDDTMPFLSAGDDDDDDASLDYLTDAVSDFFHTVCVCDWNNKRSSPPTSSCSNVPLFHPPPTAAVQPPPMFMGKQTADI